jgi:hypothetical protein
VQCLLNGGDLAEQGEANRLKELGIESADQGRVPQDGGNLPVLDGDLPITEDRLLVPGRENGHLGGCHGASVKTPPAGTGERGEGLAGVVDDHEVTTRRDGIALEEMDDGITSPHVRRPAILLAEPVHQADAAGGRGAVAENIEQSHEIGSLVRKWACDVPDHRNAVASKMDQMGHSDLLRQIRTAIMAAAGGMLHATQDSRICPVGEN